MPSWTADEKASLTNSNDGLSDTATFGGSTVYGMFINDYIDITLSMGDISSSSPAFHCAASSVPAAVKGSTLNVSGVTYSVTIVKPDGTGMTTLVLKKQ